MKLQCTGLSLISVLSLATQVTAQEITEQRLTPDQIPWPQSQTNQTGSGMAPGLRTTYLVGDGTKEGLYTLVFELGPGAQIAPHSHPDSRSCFVLSGNWYFAYGEQFDATSLQVLPPGSHYTEPGGRAHFAETRETPVLVECTSVGPTGTTFFTPANDPRSGTN